MHCHLHETLFTAGCAFPTSELPPFSDPKFPLTLIHSFLLILPHTPSSFLDRGMGEIIIMF